MNNNQTATYVIDDMVQAIEEMKVSSEEEVRTMRSAVNIQDELQAQQDIN